MRKLFLLFVIAAAAVSSGCDDNNDPDPYVYGSGGIDPNSGGISGSAGY